MEYLIVVVIIAVIAGVVYMIAKKDANERNEMVSKLTEEQKNLLMQSEIKFVEKNAWVQTAIVAKMKDKGNKVDIRLLWYDTTINNNEYNTITIADASITKAEQEIHNLKIGDAVEMYIAPEKTIGRVKIVFEEDSNMGIL